ncbi:MAG: hypothetical protein IPO22_10250 [Anaerolineales bacterium]|nr:hypothetical protein [Anaerolineales bacterium]
MENDECGMMKDENIPMLRLYAMRGMLARDNLPQDKSGMALLSQENFQNHQRRFLRANDYRPYS